MKRLFAFIAISGVLALTAVSAPRADDVSVHASIDPTTVEVGGQTVLTIEVTGKFRNSASPLLPPLDDFDKYEAGTSQNFSFVNGQTSSSITYNYILSPKKEGTYTIQPIRFQVGDKQYSANPVTVTVVAAQPGVNVPQGNAPQSSPGTHARGDLPGEDESIFVGATVDKDTVYVNQQVTWTLGYYTDGRVELLRSPNYSPPSSEGFWVEDLPPQNKYYSNIHNRQYLVSEIKRAYFPTAPGVYTIGEARVDIVVDDFGRGNNISDFFSRGMAGGFGQQKSLTTKARKIYVKPLPDKGKPADFGGAVASNLSVTMTADKQTAQVGEPVNVTVEVNGTGNMRTLSPPKLNGIDKFKFYESGNSTDSYKNDYVISGRRKFQFVIVPQVEGQFTVPPVSISYFDPAKRTYRVAQSDAVPLRVNPGTNENGRKIVYAGGSDDFQVLNRDIRFIHTPPAMLAAAQTPFYTHPWFFAAQALPVVLLAGSMLVERRRRRYREDIGFARRSRALRDAERRLMEADGAFRAAKPEAGFAAMHAAMYGYFADRANVPAASLSNETIAAWLETNGVDAARIEETRRVIAACDMARYAAASADTTRGRELAKQARETLAAIEKVIA